MLGALGARVLVQTPRSVTAQLGEDVVTLPLRLLGGAPRTPWLSLADLERFTVNGEAGLNLYAKGVYIFQLGGKAALSLRLDLPALLPMRPVREFPDVIERPNKP